MASNARHTTSDADILRLRRFLIDVDPVRPAGISATDAERAAALDRRDALRRYLREALGWPGADAILETGNGGGMLYRLDLPNDDEHRALIKAVLNALNAWWSDGAVTIDTQTGNPARMVKIPGTVAAKGDHLPERPFRLATARLNPDPSPVAVDRLHAPIDQAPVPAPPHPPSANGTGPGRDWTVADLLRQNGIGFVEKRLSYGLAHILDQCLTSDDHCDGASIIEFPSGALSYTCRHNRCADKRWDDVREVLGLARREAPTSSPASGQRVAADSGSQQKPVTPATPEWPSRIDRAAFHGLAGDIVDALLPHTEADEVGLLLTLLASVGNIADAQTYWEVSGRRHGLRVWPVLVGATSKGRKGTSWGTLRPVLKCAAGDWLDACVNGGLSSGEGLIWLIRDEITRYAEGTFDVVDPGVADKRAFLIEEEFSGTLKIAGREGNSLSAILRKAYDGDRLASLTKNSPARSSNPHVTIVGHTTAEELRRYLDDTAIASGLGNRLTFACVKRSKFLPDGGALDSALVEDLGQRLEAALRTVKDGGCLHRDEAASALWRRIYEPLSEGGVGLLGALTSRAEAQVMRFAAIYAILDGSVTIRAPHLGAGVAVWDFAAASAKYIFGDWLGDPVADTILHALNGGALTQTEISNVFGRNRAASNIHRALAALVDAGRIERVQSPTGEGGGRPPIAWQRVSS